eukprot:6663159-Pyramimonas_sp.AAC.1
MEEDEKEEEEVEEEEAGVHIMRRKRRQNRGREEGVRQGEEDRAKGEVDIFPCGVVPSDLFLQVYKPSLGGDRR